MCLCVYALLALPRLMKLVFGVVLVFVVLFSCQVLHVLLHSGCDFPGKSRHGADLVCGLSE